MFTKVCLFCGEEFIPRHGNQKTCSAKCKRAHAKQWHSRVSARKHYEPRECAYCSVVFTPTYPNQKCCSEQHGDLFYKATIGNKRQRNKRAEKKAIKGPATCKYCGKKFIPNIFHRKFCSIDHKRLYDRKNRRLLERGIIPRQYTKEQIFKRDHYKCCICGKPLNMNTSVPAWDAPTIDHILPLAKDGSDEIDNVQSAHYRCNLKKGART